MKTQINILKITIVCLMTMVFNFYVAKAAEVKFFVHGECVATQTTDNNNRVVGYVPDEDCEDKHFVGWSETNQTELTQTAPTDLFKIFRGKKGHTFTQNTNLYAIYATPNERSVDEGEYNQDLTETPSEMCSMETNVYCGTYTKFVVENVTKSVPGGIFQTSTNSAKVATITTDRKIYGLKKISIAWSGYGQKVTIQIEISTDKNQWTSVNSTATSSSISDSGTLIKILDDYEDYYVRIKVSSTTNTERHVDISQFTFTCVPRYQYSNYSTNCDNFTPIVIGGNEGSRNLSDFHLDETKTVIVQAGGVVVADELTTVGNLAIEKGNGLSSQILQAEKLTVTNNVYFDVNINAAAMTWYNIAVPFTVDRLAGLSLPDGSNIPVNDVLVYNGATRAAKGTNGSAWEYQDDGDLIPGKGYYIMFATPVETVRFTKKADAPLNNENKLAVNEFISNNSTDANWNLVANNSLHYVNLSFAKGDNSDVVAQIYNPSTDSYEPCSQDKTTYLVGTPFFVQVAKADKIAWNTTETPSILRAPAMTTNRVERFTIELSANGEMNDRLFVSADEDARNEYQIGKDVAKMGISSTIAQMWVENYNTNLCANEAVLFNDQASFPLGIFVPKNGEYTLAITNAPDNAELYLTQDGQPIWNLSKGAYTAEWTKGTHNEYGLMLQVTDAKAPTNLNGLNGNDKAVKFLKNSDIYILRNAKLYNATGQLVK